MLQIIVVILSVSVSGIAARAPGPLAKLATWTEIVPCFSSATFSCVLSDGSILGLGVDSSALESSLTKPRQISGPVWTIPAVFSLQERVSSLQALGGNSTKWVAPAVRVWQGGNEIVAEPQESSTHFSINPMEISELVRVNSEWDLHLRAAFRLFVPDATIEVRDAAGLLTLAAKTVHASPIRSEAMDHGCAFAEEALDRSLLEIVEPVDLEDKAALAIACFWSKTALFQFDEKTGKYRLADGVSAQLKRSVFSFGGEVSIPLDWFITVSSPLCEKDKSLSCKPASDVAKWVVRSEEKELNAQVLASLKVVAPVPLVLTEIVDKETGFLVRNIHGEAQKRTGDLVPRLELRLVKTGRFFSLEKKYRVPRGAELDAIEKRTGIFNLGVVNLLAEQSVYLISPSGEKTHLKNLGMEASLSFDKFVPVTGMESGTIPSAIQKGPVRPAKVGLEQKWKDNNGAFTLYSEVEIPK